MDGNWGGWEQWQSCSVTCGTGVTKRIRSCNAPAPQNGGQPCVGDEYQHRTCNQRPCQGEDQVFSRMHATKQVTVSVCLLVCQSVLAHLAFLSHLKVENDCETSFDHFSPISVPFCLIFYRLVGLSKGPILHLFLFKHFRC